MDIRLQIDVSAIEKFKEDVINVSDERNLAIATEYGLRLNRLVSAVDRQANLIPAHLRPLLDLAHTHVQNMLNCPRRMRLDDVWPVDFVEEARKAADALISLAEATGDGAD
jgi:hypothetical protein